MEKSHSRQSNNIASNLTRKAFNLNYLKCIKTNRLIKDHFTSKHQDSVGTNRKTFKGCLDSSFISAEYNETARVRTIKNASEYQKYTEWATDGWKLN